MELSKAVKLCSKWLEEFGIKHKIEDLVISIEVDEFLFDLSEEEIYHRAELQLEDEK